ncbi:MAG: UMP kinase [Alphaproteobacteria bacterium]
MPHDLTSSDDARIAARKNGDSPLGDVRYKRILLKISGEALMGDKAFGIDAEAVKLIAQQIGSVYQLGVEICLVIGGGNIFRGISAAAEMERTTADYMGMLGTVMNALALQSGLENDGIPTRVLSAVPMNTICEPYIRRRAMRHLEKGRIVIFAAGTGNPYFTTDSAAALRASEMECDVVMKATKVDGVYDSDPKINPNAKRFQTISYQTALERNLRVMDTAAIALCREKKLPILVFSMFEPNSFSNIVRARGAFTQIMESAPDHMPPT